MVIRELVGILGREFEVEPKAEDGGWRIPGSKKIEPVWGGFGFKRRGNSRVLVWDGTDLSRDVLEARACYDADYGIPSEFAPQSADIDIELYKVPLGQRMLSIGDFGRDVYQVQRMLGPVQVGEADGIYGQHTEAGVRRYQRRVSLEVTGEVDRNTWKRIRGIVPNPPRSLLVPYDPEDPEWVRKTLRAAGHGPVAPYGSIEGALARMPRQWNGLTNRGLKQLHANAYGRGAFPDMYWPVTLNSIEQAQDIDLTE